MADDLTTRMKAEAVSLGFDLAKVCRPDSVGHVAAGLDGFLAKDYHGQMQWLEARKHWRSDPSVLWPEARSVIMLGESYTPEHDPTAVHGAPDRAAISVYAQNRDYHDTVKKRLKRLARWLIAETSPETEVKVFVDTAPVPEKPLGQAAGLGWQGKHTNLVSRDLGSWFFIGSVFTTLELETDKAEIDHCGSCRACLDACPTKAFPAPHQIDARRCISYLNIELRNAPIPRELRAGMQDWLFGCDICQDVCPWNRMAGESTEPAFQPQKSRNPADCVALLTMTEEEFDANFQSSPLARPQRAGLLRNAAVVLGNAGDRTVVPALVSAMSDDEPLVRGACAWALGEIGGTAAIEALTSRLKREKDGGVLSEIQTALERSSETSG